MRKSNMKGFTLIELLAVIVILAIVALVTTPIILNVLEGARVDGAKDKAWGTMEAVKLAYTQAAAKGEDASVTEKVVKVEFTKTATAVIPGTTQKVAISGDRPESGTVSIDESTGAVTCEKLLFSGNGKYECTSNGNTMDCAKK